MKFVTDTVRKDRSSTSVIGCYDQIPLRQPGLRPVCDLSIGPDFEQKKSQTWSTTFFCPKPDRRNGIWASSRRLFHTVTHEKRHSAHRLMYALGNWIQPADADSSRGRPRTCSTGTQRSIVLPPRSSSLAASASPSRLHDMSTDLRLPASARSTVLRVDDHSSVGNFNASPSAVCISRWFGYTEDQNCWLRFSKLFSSQSVIMEQSAVGTEEDVSK